MIDTISLLLQIFGLILLIAGYRQSNRRMVLGAALLLWLGAGTSDFLHGFVDGWHDGAHV